MLRKNLFISIIMFCGMIAYLILGNFVFNSKIKNKTVDGVPLVILNSDSDIIDLTGHWLFNSEDNSSYSKDIIDDINWSKINVPGLWNFQGYNHNGSSWFRHYFINNNNNSLSLLIPKVIAGYEVYINGVLIGGLGKINIDGSLEREETHINIINIPKKLVTPGKKNSIAIRVSTMSADGGFVETPFKIGESKRISIYFQRYLLYYACISAILLFVGIYFIIIYIVDHTYKHNLLFGILGILAALFVVGQKSLGYWISSNHWINLLGFLYIPLAILPYILVNMIHRFFRRKIPKPIYIVMNSYIFILFFIISIPFSQDLYMFFFEKLVIIIYVVTILVLAYCMIISEYAINTNFPGSQVISIGISIFSITAIINALSNSGVYVIYDPLSEGLLLLCIFMSTAAAMEVSSIRKKLSKTNMSLDLHNKSLHRFVPFEFFSLLNKHNILEINAGDNKAIETTILFTDIRSFTSLSEKMSPRENFDFINRFLAHMVPVINKYNGFVDKYIGDAIMAIFPGSPDDAVNASIEMQEELKIFNKKRESEMKLAIEMGIGIHFGKLMLGIIGNETRLEGTVISDTVNIASRIESLTKMFGSNILISNDLFLELNSLESYDYRFIGLIDIKGKDEPISIFEIYNADNNNIIDMKNITKDDFEKGIMSFSTNNIEESKIYFDKVLKVNKNDKTAQCFVEKIKVKEIDNSTIKRIEYFNEIDANEELEELEEV